MSARDMQTTRLLEEARALIETRAPAIPGVDSAALLQFHGLEFVAPTIPLPRGREEQALLAHAAGVQTAVRISRMLESGRIEHVLLKGPLLQEQLYRDAALRPYTDLDVLVSAKGLAATRHILLRSGWKTTDSALLRSVHFHDVFVPVSGSGLHVEVHRSLIDRANLFRVSEREVLQRRVTRRVPGGTLPGLAPEDHLLYLCLHAAKHGFLNETALALGRDAAWFLHPACGNRLLWYLDIALLLQKTGDTLDWQALADRVRHWNITRPVAASLSVLALLLPPSRAGDALARMNLQGWRARAGGASLRRLVRGITDVRSPALRTNRRWTLRPARFAQIPDLLFPPRDELARFYRTENRAALIALRFAHPAAMLKRLLRS